MQNKNLLSVSLTDGCNTKYSSRQIGHGFPVVITPCLCKRMSTALSQVCAASLKYHMLHNAYKVVWFEP